jgi:hypothetical protein
LVAVGVFAALPFVASTITTPAHAAACPDPDYPCDPVPPRPGKPSVSFGCGTVTVRSGDISVTLPILPCPGPVLF